ncbi:hypothetical protein [Wenzhouxiangella sp. EGI_FJ10409]|uniref:hypothetical protein n=1 Tax=Wenzhouxiangella sp. EGI_FJ10409 TaxID=3243767 RepID=UPI0035DC4338
MSSNQQAVRGDAPATYLTGTGRDYAGLESNDRAVKFWVPEPVWEALWELAAYYDSDLSSVVRHVLFAHVYGHYDFLALAERGDQRFLPQGEKEAFLDVPMYSRSAAADNRTAELGKNDHDLKVWMPQALASELEQLAGRTDISRSEYIRETLVSHLFGRVQLPDRR